MKIKVTIWFEDPELDELSDSIKEVFKEELEQELFDGSSAIVKQIEIEESNFED